MTRKEHILKQTCDHTGACKRAHGQSTSYIYVVASICCTIFFEKQGASSHSISKQNFVQLIQEFNSKTYDTQIFRTSRFSMCNTVCIYMLAFMADWFRMCTTIYLMRMLNSFIFVKWKYAFKILWHLFAARPLSFKMEC